MEDLVCALIHYLASMGFDPMATMEECFERGKWHYTAEAMEEPHENPDGSIAGY
jgi:hypothetical protein